jgi:hypothetical protein
MKRLNGNMVCFSANKTLFSLSFLRYLVIGNWLVQF